MMLIHDPYELHTQRLDNEFLANLRNYLRKRIAWRPFYLTPTVLKYLLQYLLQHELLFLFCFH